MHRFGDDDEEEDFEDEVFEEIDEVDEDDVPLDGDEDFDEEDDEDLDADEEAEQEMMASGAQRCPICGKRGAPDDLDACPHFHAVVWDDEVVVGGDELQPAWEELEDIWNEHEEIFQDAYADEFDDKLARAPGGLQRVIRDGLMDENPLFWTEDADTVERESGGADSTGSGYGVYHRSADFMAKLVSDMQKARRWLEKFANARLEDDE